KNLEVESICPIPNNVSCTLYSQCVVDPVHEPVRTRAAELDFKLILGNFCIRSRRVFTNMFRRADFIWAHDLSIIDEEYRDLRGFEKFSYLWLGRLEFLFCVATIASITNAMGFVADQHVDFVELCPPVTIEVLKCRARAVADDFPQRFGKRLRASGIVRVATFA